MALSARDLRETAPVVDWKTPQGALTAISQAAHPLEYPVDSLEALRIYREMGEGAAFVTHDNTATLASLGAIIGDQGVVTRLWGPSAIPPPPGVRYGCGGLLLWQNPISPAAKRELIFSNSWRCSTVSNACIPPGAIRPQSSMSSTWRDLIYLSTKPGQAH